MGNTEQIKEIKKRLNNFIMLDTACVVIVLIVASLINVDWSSIFGEIQPQVSTTDTGDVLNAVGAENIGHQMSGLMGVMSNIMGILLTVMVMVQLLRIGIDLLYIAAPSEFEKVIPKQLTSENIRAIKESKEPMSEYFKMLVPALLVLIVTAAIVLIGVDNIMMALMNMILGIVE